MRQFGASHSDLLQGNENNGFPNDGTNDGFEQNLSVGGNTFNIVGTFDLRQGYGFEMRGVTVNITLAEGHHFDFNNQGLLQARIEISAFGIPVLTHSGQDQ